MKQLIFSFLALCFLTSAHAQTVGFTKELEPAILQCTYKCTMKLDTLGTDTKTDRMILRIGQNISQFYSYTAYRTDSIWKTPNGKRIWGDAMVRAIRSKNYDQMPNANMISNDYIYKNYPEGKLSTYAQLGVTSALIEEDYIDRRRLYRTRLDAERQHQNPLGISVPACHVQLPREGLSGMVHLGNSD